VWAARSDLIEVSVQSVGQLLRYAPRVARPGVKSDQRFCHGILAKYGKDQVWFATK
jgi:hypothetical protein